MKTFKVMNRSGKYIYIVNIKTTEEDLYFMYFNPEDALDKANSLISEFKLV